MLDFGWLWCVGVDSFLVKKKKNYFLVNDVDHGESYEYMGARGVQEISVASS